MNSFYAVCYSSPWYFTFALYYFLLLLSKGVALAFTQHNIKRHKDEASVYKRKSYELHLSVAFIAFVLSLLIGGILDVVLRLTPPLTKSLIPAITSATYTFFKMFNSIRNLVKAKKGGQSVAFLTFKDIGLIDAIASMLMLEVTMIYANGDFEPMRTLMTISGICFMVLAVIISVIMMVRGIRGLRRKETKETAR